MCGHLVVDGAGAENGAMGGEGFRSTTYLDEQRRLQQDSLLVRQFLDLFDELG